MELTKKKEDFQTTFNALMAKAFMFYKKHFPSAEVYQKLKRKAYFLLFNEVTQLKVNAVHMLFFIFEGNSSCFSRFFPVSIHRIVYSFTFRTNLTYVFFVC